MATRPKTALVLLLTTLTLAVAGCGGSSKKPSGSGAGTGTSVPSVLSPSTKVSSAAYRAFTERGLAQIPGVPKAAISKIVTCVVQKELSQGVTTVAAVKVHASQVRSDGITCARAAGLH
jgi:hypothetical protein